MNYFVKHDGTVIQKILDDNFRAIINYNGESVIAGYRGKKYEEYPASEYLAFTTTAAKYKYIGSSSNYKWVSGSPVLMTEAEIQAKDLANEKLNVKNNCDQLYKQLRRNFLIQETETYEFDLEALLLFDSQVKNKTSYIKVKEKDNKIMPLSKAKADAISTKVNLYLESLADAHGLDWDLIEAGTDYTLPNLNAIKTAQEVLKAQ